MWCDQISHDVRAALRGLHKRPTFIVVAVVVLAVGIGANTAIFSLLNSLLLRDLPFRDSGNLVMINENFPNAGLSNVPVSAPDYLYLKQHATAFSEMAAFDTTDFELSGTGSSVRVFAARISPDLPEVLGIQPILGRGFTEVEDQGKAHVLLLSYGLWKSRFHATKDVLGTTVLLDREPFVIVGVMPEGCVFPLRGPAYNSEPAALFVPMSFSDKELHGFGDMYDHSVIARLKRDTSIARAQGEVAVLVNQLSHLYPPSLRDDAHYAVTGSVMQLQQAVTGKVRKMLLMLQAAVLLLLFIACADVANLLLARSATREREMAIRAALGSGRWRIVRQLLAESFVIAAASAVLGVVLAHLILQLLVSSSPDQLQAAERSGLSTDLLIFTIAASALTAGIATVLPAMHSSRVDLNVMLDRGGRSGMANRKQNTVLRLIIIAQFAFAMMLVVCTALLTRSFVALAHTNPGFSTQNILTLETDLPSLRYNAATQVRNFDLEILRETSALPGVVSVGIATALPLQTQDRNLATPEDSSLRGGATDVVIETFVAGDYFRAMQIPLIRGRYFTPKDELGRAPVAIVSKSLAQKFWAGRDPIGQNVKVGSNSNATLCTVIGVVGDVMQGVNAESEPQTYIPLLSEPDESFQPATGTWN